MCEKHPTSPNPSHNPNDAATYNSDQRASHYTIYLLTVWFDSMENASDPANWRFRLENSRTKESKGFVGLAMLVKGVTETNLQEKAVQRQSQATYESTAGASPQ